jgi:hypothetical protein
MTIFVVIASLATGGFYGKVFWQRGELVEVD